MQDFRLQIDGKDVPLSLVKCRECVSAVGRALVVVPLRGVRGAYDDLPEVGDASAFLGKAARLTRVDDGSEVRAFAGEVTDVKLTLAVDERHAEITIEPRVARLRLRSDCRTFRDKALADIAKDILKGAGYASGDVDTRIASPPAKRTHVTQYRETDLAFLERLLGEAGLSLYVTAGDSGDAIVITDGDLGKLDPGELTFRNSSGLSAGDVASVWNVVSRRQVRPGKVTLRDADFKHPKANLTKNGQAGSDAEKGLEVYDFPARAVQEGEIEARAKIVLGRLRADRDTLTGETSCAKVAPGLRLTLKDHPYGALNREFLVTAVDATFSRAAAAREDRITFEAIGTGELPMRPAAVNATNAAARVTPGIQTAFVTGTSGQEIDPDDSGRVTFHPHWDRRGPKDEKASARARAVQPAVGGSMLTPRVGWEIVVGFLEGDVDAPLVLGRMTHGAHPPAYSLPSDKTKLSIKTLTTPGGGSANEIRFEDKKGGEEMFIGASKHATTDVGNNATEKVKANETRDISGNQKFSVTGAVEEKVVGTQAIKIGGSQTIGIGTLCVDDVGSLKCSVSGSRSLTIGGDHKRTVSADATLKIGGTSLDLVAGTVGIKCLATRKDTLSSASILVAAGSRLVNVTGARTENAGAVKAVLSAGDHIVKVTGALKQTVTAAVGALVRGDRADSASGTYLEVAAGANIIKATNVVIEGQSLVTITMGASTLTLTPASVSIAGTSVKVTGTSKFLGIIADNV